MPKGEIVYLDTSVVSARFDSRSRERMEVTERFFDDLSSEVVCISDIVVRELAFIADGRLRDTVLRFAEPFRILPLNEEVERLANEYVGNEVVPCKYYHDALHIAAASVHRCNVLVSWNFEHIVKRRTKVKVNALNAARGYKTLEIVSPLDY